MGCSDIQSEIDSLNDEIATYEGYISELEEELERIRAAELEASNS